jgi:membrane-bound metal-dependent hydrolase YbcI (DUF457 family)
VNSATHAAIGSAIASVFYSDLDAIAVAAIASQIPDIDSTSSAIGAMVYPLARWLEASGHRGFTHSFLFCGLLSAGVFALAVYYLGNQSWGVATAIGLFSSVVADCFTKQGVQLFWPWRVWCVVGLNPNRRLKSGSLGEYWIILLCGLVLAVSFQLRGLSGIALNLPSNSSEIFLQYPTYCISAKVKAQLNSDRSIVSGQYLAIAIGTFWRPGELISSRNSSLLSVSYKAVEDCGVSAQVVAFNEENSSLLQKFVGTYSFVFGSIAADEPLSNGGEFTGEPIGQAIDAIGSAWISGNLSIKSYKKLIEL